MGLRPKMDLPVGMEAAAAKSRFLTAALRRFGMTSAILGRLFWGGYFGAAYFRSIPS